MKDCPRLTEQRFLKLPSEQAIYESQIIIEPALIRAACQAMQKKIGQRLKTSFEDKVKPAQPREYINMIRISPENEL